ncbi:hypothetical protein HPB51_026430 [Rhipicephalus microplus]|uniref:Uncharacterized protein n=1 Tax=Rhipicephalus microplus TaxID=6941 RepID=A0A9J6D3P0_RHIMP|nr:hypothetical protein HPB51_026430 [Rhipicephalus microplus]
MQYNRMPALHPSLEVTVPRWFRRRWKTRRRCEGLVRPNQSEGRLVTTPSGEKNVLTLGAEKGLSKSGLTVSIVVEPVDPSAAACVDDDPYTCKTPTPAEEDMVRSLIMNAELRKEEFAKLLEEHAQIVMEINKAENSLA